LPNYHAERSQTARINAESYIRPFTRIDAQARRTSPTGYDRRLICAAKEPALQHLRVSLIGSASGIETASPEQDVKYVCPVRSRKEEMKDESDTPRTVFRAYRIAAHTTVVGHGPGGSRAGLGSR
jgi:hypothetical protein